VFDLSGLSSVRALMFSPSTLMSFKRFASFLKYAVSRSNMCYWVIFPRLLGSSSFTKPRSSATPLRRQHGFLCLFASSSEIVGQLCSKTSLRCLPARRRSFSVPPQPAGSGRLIPCPVSLLKSFRFFVPPRWSIFRSFPRVTQVIGRPSIRQLG